MTSLDLYWMVTVMQLNKRCYMKSLKESLFDSKAQMTESLFDKDLVSKDLCIGDIYKLSNIAYDNSFSGFPAEFVDLFKPQELKKIAYDYKYVDLKNGFIEYWREYLRRFNSESVPSIIDIIFRAPANILNKNMPSKSERQFKEYLKPYIRYSCYDDFTVFFKFLMDGIMMTFYDNVLNSHPSSMEIVLYFK